MSDISVCDNEKMGETSTASTPSAKKTRKSSEVFGLGSKISKDDEQITGSRLPTCLQVLRCLMFHIGDGTSESRSRWEAAKLVFSKVAVFYEKANIPMIAERQACEKMIKLLDHNARMRAIPIKRRSTPASVKLIQQMKVTLAETFRLWPANVEQRIKNTEDLCFLQSMKGDRSATFGPCDKVLATKVQRRETRVQAEAARREKVLSKGTSTATSASVDAMSMSDSDNMTGDDDVAGVDSEVDTSSVGANVDISSTTPRTHHRATRIGTPAFIPHDIIKRPKLVALATRLKMTPAQQATYTKALIAEVGGDSSKVSLSYATADKTRRKVGKNLAKATREQWVAPKLATLHWDSKLMASLSNPNAKVERLTVVVGTSLDLKLLGVPAYQPGANRKSGAVIADLTSELLLTWNCADSIVSMTFDTTASNTGHVTAACVTIQQRLGRALLWSACRHHVGEIVLSHVFDDLQIETSKSPDITLFTRFRKNFNLLSVVRSANERLSRFNSTVFSESAQSFIAEWRDNMLTLARSELPTRRDDYKEFIELCMVFLDGEVAERRVTFKRPGALHKARWMAKLIYSIKICLFEQQVQDLPRGTIMTLEQVLKKVRDFVNFSTLIYSTWWITSNSMEDAPWNDLNLYQSLLKYEDVHPEISSSAIRAFQLHLWYLTAELVPVALWSNKVSEDARRDLADKLLAMKPDAALLSPQQRFGTGFGKPRFPTSITLTTTLADLVTPDSWYVFHLLQLDPQFLTEDVATWPSSVAYQSSLINLRALNVVNDCAERGVKLSSDFLSSAKGEEHYQNVLQVVEQDRKRQQNIRRSNHPAK